MQEFSSTTGSVRLTDGPVIATALTPFWANRIAYALNEYEAARQRRREEGARLAQQPAETQTPEPIDKTAEFDTTITALLDGIRQQLSNGRIEAASVSFSALCDGMDSLASAQAFDAVTRSLLAGAAL